MPPLLELPVKLHCAMAAVAEVLPIVFPGAQAPTEGGEAKAPTKEPTH